MTNKLKNKNPLGPDEVTRVLNRFERALAAAERVEGRELAKWAEFGRDDCRVALKLLEHGEEELATHVYARTLDYDHLMEAAFCDHVAGGGENYKIFPEDDDG